MSECLLMLSGPSGIRPQSRGQEGGLLIHQPPPVGVASVPCSCLAFKSEHLFFFPTFLVGHFQTYEKVEGINTVNTCIPLIFFTPFHQLLAFCPVCTPSLCFSLYTYTIFHSLNPKKQVSDIITLYP